MADLNSVVTIAITRVSTSVSRANFGVPAIIAEFATDKTATTFDRYRTYASLTEMADDDWTSSDAVYTAAQKIFAQNPTVTTIMVGRKDDSDADFDAALTAIQEAYGDWYGFGIIPSTVATIVFDADFVASNSIVFTINGTAVTAVPFNTDHDTTMDDCITQIEADIANSSVSLDTGDPNNRTLIISIFGQTGVSTASVVVTGGASQPTGTTTYDDQDQYENVADWVETQSKIFGIESTDADILDSGVTTDIASYIESNNYDRTFVIYNTSEEYAQFAWMGEAFPYDAGSQTWAYKTPSGITSYEITSSQASNAWAKNANTYREVAGVDVTQYGTMGSGEYIDVMRGVDWIEANIQEEVYTMVISSRKIPYTDEGVNVIIGAIRKILQDAVQMGILRENTIEIDYPNVADISTTDRGNRLLPDVEFTAELAGAIHKTTISGIVSV